MSTKLIKMTDPRLRTSIPNFDEIERWVAQRYGLGSEELELLRASH